MLLMYGMVLSGLILGSVFTHVLKVLDKHQYKQDVEKELNEKCVLLKDTLGFKIWGKKSEMPTDIEPRYFPGQTRHSND